MRIAVIPARGGSKRLPDKNIADFCGRPMLAYPLQAAAESGLFDRIHVSTDSARIADVAAGLGAPVSFMRDPALADDHTPLMPVLQWVLARFAEQGQVFDEVCLLMPTAPLIKAEDLVRAHALFLRHRGKRSVLAVARFPVAVEWAFRMGQDGRLRPCEPGMAHKRSQDLDEAYYDTGTFMFLPAEQVRRGKPDDTNYVGFILPRARAIDIDDVDDLDFARILYRGAGGDMTGA